MDPHCSESLWGDEMPCPFWNLEPGAVNIEVDWDVVHGMHWLSGQKFKRSKGNVTELSSTD